MPSPMFNFLFVVALFVPIAMYICGVLVLMFSLVRSHYRVTHPRTRTVEALVH